MPDPSPLFDLPLTGDFDGPAEAVIREFMAATSVPVVFDLALRSLEHGIQIFNELHEDVEIPRLAVSSISEATLHDLNERRITLRSLKTPRPLSLLIESLDSFLVARERYLYKAGYQSLLAFAVMCMARAAYHAAWVYRNPGQWQKYLRASEAWDAFMDSDQSGPAPSSNDLVLNYGPESARAVAQVISPFVESIRKASKSDNGGPH